LKVRVTTGDLLTAKTQAIVHVTDGKLSDTSVFSRRLYEAAGAGVQSACREHAVDALPNGHCYITEAGDLAPIRRIVHYVVTGDNTSVRASKLACLNAADAHDSNIVSLTMPFFSEQLHPHM
jgi:O-acetyl-ADP-ribose deacetylase (regulator of RNase III)